MQVQIHGMRALATVVAVSLLALFGALQNFADADRAAKEFSDPYRVMPRQEALALPEVPAGARTGYFSDVPVSTTGGTVAFLASQYAVAPRLLVERERAADAVWWIGGFSKRLDYRAEGAALGLQFVRELSGAIALYRKDTR